MVRALHTEDDNALRASAEATRSKRGRDKHSATKSVFAKPGIAGEHYEYLRKLKEGGTERVPRTVKRRDPDTGETVVAHGEHAVHEAFNADLHGRLTTATTDTAFTPDSQAAEDARRTWQQRAAQGVDGVRGFSDREHMGVMQAEEQIYRCCYAVPFTMLEVLGALQAQKTGKREGLDQMLETIFMHAAQRYKSALDEQGGVGASPGDDDSTQGAFFELIALLYRRIWETGEIPQRLRSGLMLPMYKSPKDILSPRSWRPIVLFPFLAKVLHKLVITRSHMMMGYTRDDATTTMNEQYMDGWEAAADTEHPTSKLHPAQYGSTPDRKGTLEPLLSYYLWADKARASGGGYTSVYDQADAYTTVSHARTLHGLYFDHGIRGQLWWLHHELLHGVTLRILLGARMTKEHEFEVGAAQGTGNAPFEWTVCFDGVPYHIHLRVPRTKCAYALVCR